MIPGLPLRWRRLASGCLKNPATWTKLFRAGSFCLGKFLLQCGEPPAPSELRMSHKGPKSFDEAFDRFSRLLQIVCPRPGSCLETAVSISSSLKARIGHVKRGLGFPRAVEHKVISPWAALFRTFFKRARQFISTSKPHAICP